MRISDWSSDVCSSDLRSHASRRYRGRHRQACRQPLRCRTTAPALARPGRKRARHGARLSARHGADRRGQWRMTYDNIDPRESMLSYVIRHRSEEQKSELQSLMRISYAVFCLKNKQTNISLNSIHTTIMTTASNQYTNNTQN